MSQTTHTNTTLNTADERRDKTLGYTPHVILNDFRSKRTRNRALRCWDAWISGWCPTNLRYFTVIQDDLRESLSESEVEDARRLMKRRHFDFGSQECQPDGKRSEEIAG